MTTMAMVPAWVYRSGVSPTAILVYLDLSYRSFAMGYADASLVELGESVGVTSRTISKAITALEEVGAIRVYDRFDEEFGNRLSNRYVVVHIDPRPPIDPPVFGSSVFGL